MLRIANVIRDQHFMDAQILYHDLTNDQCTHDYFIVSWDKTVAFRYMKLADRVNIVTPDEFIQILNSREYNALFIHNFLYMPLHYMNKIPRSIKVFWFAWGYDIYNTPAKSPFVDIELWHPKSQKVLQQLHNAKSKYPLYKIWKWKLKAFLLNVFDYNHQDHNNNIRVYKNAVKRVDYFSGVFPMEYNLLVKNPEFKAKPVEFGLRNPKDWTPMPSTLPEIGKNILIGNSADINNNHLDIIDFLKNIDLKDSKLIIPLSYGGSQEYVDIVSNAYEKEFGERAIILKDYMPRDEYFKLLKSVGIAIFFQERQQGAGNIAELLRNGVKLFFSKTSINFQHYKNCGCHVFSLQDDFNSDFDSPLEDSQKWDNLKFWYSTNNREYRLNILHEIYKLL